MTRPDAPLDRPLATLVADLRGGAVSARALVEDGEARMLRHGAALGAYRERDATAARAQAHAADAAFAVGADTGLLQGLPVSVKDLYGLTGCATYAGSPRQLPAPWNADGTLVAAVRRQLAVFTGKTHTVEFAFGGLGTNPHWLPPRNPWDATTARAPGGSSAGAGVSLHCDAVLALGTDTAGSVRIPASMTGTVGVKTTHGRWPVDGIVPLSSSFDTPGLLARSAADARLAFHALDASLRGRGAAALAAPPAVAGLRLGICPALLWEDCAPGIVDAVRGALADLEQAGARLVDVRLPELEPALAVFRLGHLASAELQEFLASELPDWLATLDSNVAARMRDAAGLPAQEYLARRRTLARLAASARSVFEGVDLLVAPTVAITPPALDSLADGDAYRRANLLALRNTCVANLLGLCAATLPAGLDAARLPAGLQLIARGGDDVRLVDTLAACEAVIGTPRARLGVPPCVA